VTTILGIDPGLTRLGVGVITQGAGRNVSFVHVDVFRTHPTDAPEERLGALSRSLEALMDFHQPDVIALERVFAQHNVRTVMGTAQISGVVLALANARGVSVSLRTPSEVKAAVTGYGRATKNQVGEMVQRDSRSRGDSPSRGCRGCPSFSHHGGVAGSCACCLEYFLHNSCTEGVARGGSQS